MPHTLRNVLALIAAALIPLAAHAGPTHEVVAGFDLPPQTPSYGALVLGPDGAYWGTTEGGGAYANLMGTLGDGLGAFYGDIRNQGLLGDTTLIVFSEFSRRISENGSGGTDHGAASVMIALGGRVNGGLYGTAPNLAANGNPTLENSSGDVHYETDFRAVYASVIDRWLGADSVSLLGGNFKQSNLTFV